MNDIIQPRRVIIPYTPRPYFEPFHNSTKRNKYLVVHRRGGKTVAIGNELIKMALNNTRLYPPPRYGYIGPSFSQAKDTIWSYLKHYTKPIPGVKVSESDLQLTLPGGQVIALYPGADAYERMRGLYFDGAALDEYSLLNDDCLESVVWPCLADYEGNCIIAGTSGGDNHFYEEKKKAEADPEDWDVFDIKISETVGISLKAEEVEKMRRRMGKVKFEREMENNFEMPVDGAYYEEEMNDALERITNVPFDPSVPVHTIFDIGIRDTTCVWFVQLVGREVHVIDFYQAVNKSLFQILAEIRMGHRSKYRFGYYVMPHDIKARELTSGRTRFETLVEAGYAILVAPSLSIEDGIEAVRSYLSLCWFDKVRCVEGVRMLKAYQVGKNGKPLHNWASHGADAFRMLAISGNILTNIINGAGGGALKRRVRGVI